MPEFYKIRAIAYYEAKSLMRSTVFKIFFVLQGLLILWFMYTFLGMNMFHSMHAFSPIIPYIFTIYLNVLQAITIIFVTSHVYFSDISQNSTKALYPRPFPNIGYVIGKALGIVSLFVIIDIHCYLIFFVFHSVFLRSLPVFVTYLYYPLILILPTTIFTVGLTACVVVMLRNQVITIILLLGLIILLFSMLGIRYPFLDDITGTNLPLLYSQFIGFGNAHTLLLQRGMYVVLGLGFVLLAGTFFSRNRLTQSIRMNTLTFCLAILCFICTGYAGKLYLNHQYAGKELRGRMRDIEHSMTESSPLTLTDCRLNLVHTAYTIKVESNLCIKNTSQQAVDAYRFRLNPGLNVQSVERNGQIVPFERNLHILSVIPSASLKPDDIDSLVIKYCGTIYENACYIDIDEKQHERPNRKLRMTIDKRYSFITPEYMLLTQESDWYPTPFKPATPEKFVSNRRDFTHFQFSVTTDSSLTAISQGEPIKEAPGRFSFTPEYPLTQLSLIIGDYTKLSTTVDGIEYGVYARNGDDYTSGLEKLTEKKLQKAIRDLKLEYELQINLPYPFHRLYLVEVPVQFLAYNRDWNLTPDFVQPEQIFINEKGFLIAGEYPLFRGGIFYAGSKMIKTEEEKQYDKFHRFIDWSILTASYDRYAIGQRDRFDTSSSPFNIYTNSTSLSSFPHDYNIYPNYYPFTYYLSSHTYPFIDLLMQYYTKSKLGFRGYGVYERIYGVANNDVIRYKLTSRFSVEELLKKPEYSYMMPQIFGAKTEALFTMLQIKTGMTQEEFDTFIEDFLVENRFKCVPAENMIDKLQDVSLTDLNTYFNNLLYSTNLPKFKISDAQYTPVLIGNNEKLFYSFVVQNCGNASGVIELILRDWDNPYNVVNKLIYVEKNQIKKIGIITNMPDTTNQIYFKTFNALNRRFFHVVAIKKRRNRNTEYFNDERVIDTPLKTASPDTIIVDNTDPGFKIVSQPQLGFIRRFFGHEKPDMIELAGFNYRNPPRRWREGNANYFYGNMWTSSLYAAAGNGNGKVAWTAELSKPGKYDVYYYTPSPKQMLEPHPFKEIYTVKDLHFIINGDNGRDEAVLDADKASQRWSLIGTFSFSKETATIELTDESKGRTVYADAVKWVKKL